MRTGLAVLAAALLLAACTTEKPPSAVPAGLHLSRLGFDALPGWQEAKAQAALAAFQRSCAVLTQKPDAAPMGGPGYAGTVGDWRSVCAHAQGGAKGFFAQNFTPYAVAGDGLFTGYYEPEIRDAYRLTAKNVLFSRTQVYRNWMRLFDLPKDIASRIVFIQYEDLLRNPYLHFRTIVEKLNLPCNNLTNPSMFDPVSNRVKMRLEDPASHPQAVHPRYEFCSLVDDETLYDLILSKIDREFDSNHLGYVYPDSVEEYCREAKQNHTQRTE